MLRWQRSIAGGFGKQGFLYHPIQRSLLRLPPDVCRAGGLGLDAGRCLHIQDLSTYRRRLFAGVAVVVMLAALANKLPAQTEQQRLLRQSMIGVHQIPNRISAAENAPSMNW